MGSWEVEKRLSCIDFYLYISQELEEEMEVKNIHFTFMFLYCSRAERKSEICFMLKAYNKVKNERYHLSLCQHSHKNISSG